jgi:hypothetical protein
VRLVPEKDSLLRWLVVPFLAVGGALVAVAAWAPDLLLGVAHCPWRDATGLPCPTCGGTEAAVRLAHGQWAAAWRTNPLAPLLVLGVVAWGAWALAAAWLPALRVRPLLGPREKKAARMGAALLLALLWLRQILAT